MACDESAGGGRSAQFVMGGPEFGGARAGGAGSCVWLLARGPGGMRPCTIGRLERVTAECVERCMKVSNMSD